MSKARVTWTFGETPATTDKLNAAVQDYIRPGHLIMNSVGTTFHITTLDGNTGLMITPVLSFYPYNPQRLVFDTMRIFFNHTAIHENGSDLTNSLHLQYSLNSGATWANANPGHSASPVVLVYPMVFAGATDLGSAIRDVSLTSIAATQYIGFRYLSDSVDVGGFAWCAFAILYSSTESPF
jgi:hypothetical protein